MMELSCEEFCAKLASKDPVPGGGGSAALVGALGTALAAMVGNLTIASPKYAQFQPEIEKMVAEAEDIKKKCCAWRGGCESLYVLYRPTLSPKRKRKNAPG
jgi:formiminotetrahydrofolate cyclodeaminase